MCIVVDINVLSIMFDPNAKHHEVYKPVLNWILQGRGKLVYGGTKYKYELQSLKKILRLFTILSKYRKLVEVDSDKVDQYESSLVDFVSHKCDDKHIISIIACSACRLVCTADVSSVQFLKNDFYYPKGIKKPKIYLDTRHCHLLCDHYIVSSCRPASVPPKSLRNLFN